MGEREGQPWHDVKLHLVVFKRTLHGELVALDEVLRLVNEGVGVEGGDVEVPDTAYFLEAVGGAAVRERTTARRYGKLLR